MSGNKVPNGRGPNREGTASSRQANEQTPLISLPGNTADRRGFLRRLLIDSSHTPGRDSPNRATRYTANTFHIFKRTMLCSVVNVLLVFVPLGIIAGVGEWSATAVFTLNFFAIIPLAAMLSFATEEISENVGDAMAGLLNATFGNAVELIVSIVALKEGQIEVVQSSMLGSILSNLLLVMGMCFLLGGIFNMRDGSGDGIEQSFAEGTAQTSCSMMALSSASLIIPATLYSVLDEAGEKDKDASILVLSRGTAVILLILYFFYLWFQLRTHKNLFRPKPTDDGPVSISDAEAAREGENGAQQEDEDEEEKVEHMSPWAAAAVLIAVTLVIAVCAEYLVDSIDAIVATGAISKNFIGLILIPIVGNAAEHVTACVVAVRNKMDLAMSVAIGSSIQIALLVTPFLVILGWAVLGQPMSLRFETFETITFALSVLVVTYTINDGKSNYLEGAMLIGLYLIIALAFYASPSGALDKVLTVFHSG